MIAAIYGRPYNLSLIRVLEYFLDELEKKGVGCLLYEPFYSCFRSEMKSRKGIKTFSTAAEIRGKADFLFSVGGDGTLLDTISLVQDSGIPIAGINAGRLGFLSSISQENISKAVEEMANGHYSLDKRTLLRLETSISLFGEVNYALNELTVHKKDTSSMIIINAYLNGEFLNSYWADGLIVSTPTGSTGYSLSCGGPIIVPQSENFAITPIAPHNLNVRPVIVSDKNVISLEVEGRNRKFLATLDSRSVTIDSSVQIAVRKESFSINLVRLKDENFMKTLRNKLMWGLDTRN
jgi:NAD+ kinase